MNLRCRPQQGPQILGRSPWESFCPVQSFSRLTSRLVEYCILKSKQRHTVNMLSNYLRKAGIDHKLGMATSLQVRERLRSLEEPHLHTTLALEILPLKTQESLYYEIGRVNLRQP